MNDFLKVLDDLYEKIHNGIDVASNQRQLMLEVFAFGLKRYNEKQAKEAEKAAKAAEKESKAEDKK